MGRRTLRGAIRFFETEHGMSRGRPRATRSDTGSPPSAARAGATLSQAPSSGVRGAGARRTSGWTITREFERGGFCYRILRRPLSSGGAAPLTKREEEAVVHACNGSSNKRIAQFLGVSPSTVGVLLFRAAAKLGAKSRRELVEAYRRTKGI